MTIVDGTIVATSSSLGAAFVFARQLWLWKNHIPKFIRTVPAVRHSSGERVGEVQDWIVNFTGYLGHEGARLLAVPIYSPKLSDAKVESTSIIVGKTLKMSEPLENKVKTMLKEDSTYSEAQTLFSFLVDLHSNSMRRSTREHMLELEIHTNLVESSLLIYRRLTEDRGKLRSVRSRTALIIDQPPFKETITDANQAVNDLSVCLAFNVVGEGVFLHKRRKTHSSQGGHTHRDYILSPTLFDSVRVDSDYAHSLSTLSLEELIQHSVFHSCMGDPSVERQALAPFDRADRDLLTNVLNRSEKPLDVVGLVSNPKQGRVVLYVICYITQEDIYGRQDLKRIESVQDSDLPVAASAKALLYLLSELEETQGKASTNNARQEKLTFEPTLPGI